MKSGDYYVTYNGSRWTVEQDGELVSSHRTQQAAVDWAKANGGPDLRHLSRKLVDVWWTDREGRLQGHNEFRSIVKPRRAHIGSTLRRLFSRSQGQIREVGRERP